LEIIMSEVLTGSVKRPSDLLTMRQELQDRFGDVSKGCRFAYDEKVPCGTYTAELVSGTVYVGLCACSMSFLFLAVDRWKANHDGQMPEGMGLVSLVGEN
jgi:hypothetical protein